MRGDTRVDTAYTRVNKSDTKDYGAQARNQLGAPGGAEFSEPKFFKLCPTYFSRECEKYFRGTSSLCYGPGEAPKSVGPVAIATTVNPALTNVKLCLSYNLPEIMFYTHYKKR